MNYLWTRLRAITSAIADISGVLQFVHYLMADTYGLRSMLVVLIGLIASTAGLVAATVMAAPAWVGYAGAAFIGMAVGLVAAPKIILRRQPLGVHTLYGYRWVSADISFTIDAENPRHQEHRLTIEIEALRDGVRHFTHSYLWSGDGYDSGPRAVSAGHQVLGPPRKDSGMKRYVVDLGRRLDAGQRAVIELDHILEDTAEEFETFLSKIVREPIDFVTLEVVLPPSLCPSAVQLIERVSFGYDPILVTEGLYDRHRQTIAWSIPNPTHGHSYEIRWSYPGNASMYDIARAKGSRT